MKEMVQRQKDGIFSSGIEFSINTMLLRHSWWILNHLVRNDFVGTSELTNNLSQELSKDMTVRGRGMANDSYKKNFGVACWHPRGVQKIVSSQATKTDNQINLN